MYAGGNVPKPEPKGKVINPALVQEERHREIQEKRKQRIERQNSQPAVDKSKINRQPSRGFNQPGTTGSK